MTDTYPDFKTLFEHAQEGKDFLVKVNDRGSSLLIMAPHGGNIEPGTTEIAGLIAGKSYSFYSFEGLRSVDNLTLHISSNNYDEPRAMALMATSDIILTIHGLRDRGEFIVLGGLHETLREKIADALRVAGFVVDPSYARKFPATHPSNICNKGLSRKGVQLEISRDLREPADLALRVSFAETIKKALEI